MQINRLRADFGALHGGELDLHSGLNIIQTPNESGKSTWCAFIRAMLYGIDSSERARAGRQPDKVRYAPWDGSPMCGEMEITHGGREITLARSTKTASAPMRMFSAVYTGTGEAVPGITGANAGEALTGAVRGVFESSAFIKQAGVAVSGSPELETRITALVSSGAEDECWSDADGRLRAWQRARRWNRRGRIPELEAEIAEKNDALRSLKDAGRERARLRAELEAAEQELPRIQAEIAEERKSRRRAALERLSENKRLLHERESAAQKAEEELERCRKQRAALPFGAGNTSGEVTQEAEQDARRARSLAEAAGESMPYVLFIIPVLMLIISLLCTHITWYAVAGGVLLSAVVFALLLRSHRRTMTAAKNARDELEALLLRYGAEDADGILKRAELFADACKAELSAEKDAAAARAELERVRAAQSEQDSGILSELDVSASGRRLAEAQARVSALREKLAKADGGLGVMGDPLVLESEKKELEEALARLTQQYDALELAVSALAEANAEIQTRFSPALSRRAGELFARLTGGRYEALSLDRGLAAAVRKTGDAAQRSSQFLSSGAQDQLYLAVRLAICELVLGGDEPCPIILDDALCAFDGQRLGLALELLLEIAQTRQVILFTCQERENEYLERIRNK